MLRLLRDDHLGYEKHDQAGVGSGNSCNGFRSKTVLTDVGPVEIEVPRDREGSFEAQIVKKLQCRLTGVNVMVLSLSAKYWLQVLTEIKNRGVERLA